MSELLVTVMPLMPKGSPVAVDGVLTNNELTTLLYPAVYTAIPDLQNPGLHLARDVGQVTLPADAKTFRLWCDRSQFPDNDERVIKCRAEILMLDDAWKLLSGFTASGGVINDPGTGQPETDSWWEVGIPDGTQRVVRVSVVIIQETLTEVGVLCGDV